MIWRKLLPALFFIASLQTLQAQIAKGTIMAGGNVGFQFQTNQERGGGYITFDFQPLIGGFVAKNFALGVSPRVSYFQLIGKNSGTSGYPYSALSLGLGPFARYYIKLGQRAYIFFHAAPVSLGGEWVHIYKDKSQPYSRLGVINWSIGPGLSFMVTKGIALELSAYYNGTWHQSNLYRNRNLLGNEGVSYVDHGMVLNIGIQVYFERNKKQNPVVR